MHIIRAAIATIVLLTGCVSGPAETKTDNQTAKRLVGKTRAELLQCAGTPVREVSHEKSVIFRYYKEAPMFEESRPFLKGSMAQAHHGCWVNLLLEQDEVTGVEFRPVPDGSGYDHCEEIFLWCLPEAQPK